MSKLGVMSDAGAASWSLAKHVMGGAAIGGLMTGFNQANKAASKARSFVGPMNNVGGRFSML